MSTFRVTGVSARGRRIARDVKAESEMGARKRAEQDGIAVESVTLAPAVPASARQIEYARSLGIDIPDSPTLGQMSVLIDQALDPQPAASRWLIGRARALGADIDETRFLDVRYVGHRLNEAVGLESHAAAVELVFWYLHSVLRHRLGQSWSEPSESGVPEAVMFSLAETMVLDSAAFKSLRRQYQNGAVYGYVEFGDGYGGTMSTRTEAYAAAVDLLSKANLCAVGRFK